MKVIWMVKIKSFYYLPLGDSTLEKIEPDLQSVIPGDSTIRFEHRQSQVNEWNLVFPFNAFIFYFVGFLGSFRQAQNPKNRHRSCPLRDKRCPIRTMPDQLHSGSVTALLKRCSGCAGHEYVNLNGKAKVWFFKWFWWLIMFLIIPLIFFGRFLPIKNGYMEIKTRW